jgi:hypothetical protein
VLAISDSVILSWCFYVSLGNITCSIFIDYQVDCLVSEEYVPEGVPCSLDDQSEVAEYCFGHKRNIMSLHGEGRDE